ncbi:beta-ketoacyl-[acyl-carrier-protein] synthase family protein [Nocardia sp. CDC159]|uniref:Beta-ketoacyl-[acyl-carrier-protein] synthase family protein n=1 Tax=Nocardia pulmonis TaxID=2951408 RepID=A0A9X2E8L7_9NOCA|nr:MULTISPECIES: beta-ketoacyl-[acyl-carrier-protein] synthase family protein [Nocardia]MCM6775610.1 beta-ketoacyl-[acyl-carrier-protein] synthase family protein [Nocardia pulmonis]MCM6787656.1 beta-ketoacyl-[acyl-carrier-protein] synthase family protein [Nocardia sp. CDC159]
MNRVVVTGLGAVTPIGLGRKRFWESLVAGVSGEGPITLFDAAALPTRIAAQVPDFEVGEYWDGPFPTDLREDRQLRFALAACAMALGDSGLRCGGADASRTGFIVGAGLGIVRMDDIANHLDAQGRFRVPTPLREREAIHPVSLIRDPQDLLVRLLTGHLDITGPTVIVTSACAAGAHAIGTAFRMLRRGEIDVALCGAMDSMINPLGMAGLVALGAPSTDNLPGRTGRPFDATRSGFVVGEGAGMVVLETEEHARRRGAHCYAEVAGFGRSLDSHRFTEPHPEGAGAALAMRSAMADAGVEPEQVGLINAHGTATALNDRVETLAIKTVFGAAAPRLAITANKSMTGHLIAACGAVEFIATVLSVRTGVVPPTINYRHRDADCDLDYVPGTARELPVEVALTNSFGLGGQNGCLVVRRAADPISD